jgi:hypothetical protein
VYAGEALAALEAAGANRKRSRRREAPEARP